MLCACSRQISLLSGINESEANEILAALLEKGIPAEKSKTKEGAQILVNEDRVADSLSVLNSKGLPKQKHDRMGDVFKKDSLLSSPLEERARYIFALSQELESTISQIDGVLSARVHVVLPERVAPGDPLQPSSAAVFIKHSPFFDLTAVSPKVKQMVANSIPGLNDENKEKVSVILIPSQEEARNLELEKVGIFFVEKTSAKKLKWFLGILIACIICLMIGLFYIIYTNKSNDKRGKNTIINKIISIIKK